MKKNQAIYTYLTNGNIDTNAWLQMLPTQYQLVDTISLARAVALCTKLTQGLTTFYGKSYLEQGIKTAEIILDLKLDQETVIAALISQTVQLNPAHLDVIQTELGDPVAKLVKGMQQLDVLSTQLQHHTQNQIDKMRKMLLAMATDIRVVIIKLAERLAFMHSIKNITANERNRYAQEIIDIYAPLANRLGIGQLKWELEDIAFHYLQPDAYKTIAGFLAERRADREKRIHYIISTLKNKLQTANIPAEIAGRAKHIYSIYLKTIHKQVNYQDIYDYHAVRIIVPTIADCYTALSIVNSLWPPILEEFDDYIANPKPNGYRSIHTAVVGADGKHFEIQIRTHDMHDEAERGVAAHWIYKENTQQNILAAEKISYLRQLIDWHKEVASEKSSAPSLTMDDQIYVVTPEGDIFDLPHGATPLDFAYHIHTELGHRCRGAKANGQIVSLTYQLRTGDQIEILTTSHATPSRDWLNPELHYVKTGRARSKISHWFKQQALAADIAEGKQLLERELTKAGITKNVSLASIAKQLNLKEENLVYAALSRGNIRLSHVLQAFQPKAPEKIAPVITLSPNLNKESGSAIVGGADLMMRYARCCKPIPGDDIIGYITHGRGISIHKKNCRNISHMHTTPRFIEIAWDQNHAGTFSTDIKIIAIDNEKTISELTSLLANDKIHLLHFNSTFDRIQHKTQITITIQINSIMQLDRLMERIQHLPGVLTVIRHKNS